MIKFLFSLFFSIISLMMFSQNGNTKDTATYTITVKLSKTEIPPAHCGVFAWALAQKFEVVKNESAGINPSHIIIIEPCPEFLGKDFFKKDQLYSVIIGKNSDAPFDYIIVGYTNKKLPSYWSREIHLAK